MQRVFTLLSKRGATLGMVAACLALAACRPPDRPGSARTLSTLFAHAAGCPSDGHACVPRRTFTGRIDAALVTDTLDWMQRWVRGGADAVVLDIDSQGGSVAAGMSLARAMRDLGVPVHCLVTHDAHSMAFYVLQACASRSVLPTAALMIHAPYVEGGSSARDLPVRRTPLSPRLTQQMAETLSLRMRISADALAAQIAGEAQWWFTPEQALAFGAIDAVVPSRAAHEHWVAAHVRRRR